MIEVIKFGAEWCSPCSAIAPTIEIDENPELSGKYKIKSIPTIVFIKDNEVVEKKSGVLNEAQIEEIIKSLK